MGFLGLRFRFHGKNQPRAAQIHAVFRRDGFRLQKIRALSVAVANVGVSVGGGKVDLQALPLSDQKGVLVKGERDRDGAMGLVVPQLMAKGGDIVAQNVAIITIYSGACKRECALCVVTSVMRGGEVRSDGCTLCYFH